MTDINDEALERPDIFLMLHEAVPNEVELSFRQKFHSSDVKIAIERNLGGPYAGIELYLPTTIALFIAAGFFNGFFQEAGKDAYVALKGAAVDLWRRSRSIRLVMIGTKGKVSSKHVYSLAYSITGAVVPGLNFKFVIKSDIDQDTAEEGIAAFLDLIDCLLNDRVAEADVSALLTYRPVGGTVLVTFDPEKRKIIPVNAFATDTEH
jgi:hypothetical protein